MGLLSRLFATRQRRADPPTRQVKHAAGPGATKAPATVKTTTARTTTAKNPVYKHAGCTINHRTAQAASGCRNR